MRKSLLYLVFLGDIQLLAAETVDDLPEGIRRLDDFVPKARNPQPNDVIDRIRRFVEDCRS